MYQLTATLEVVCWTLSFFVCFLFVCTVEARMRANTQKHIVTRRAGDKRGRRGKGKNSGEQRHEICGRERDRAGYTG